MNYGFGGKDGLTAWILTSRVVRKLKQGRHEADDVINKGASEKRKSEVQTRRGGGVHAKDEEARTIESQGALFEDQSHEAQPKKPRSPTGNYQSLPKNR